MECSICYEEMRVGSRHTLGCGHMYHKECLATWLRSAHTCPMCRAEIPVGVQTRVAPTMAAVIGRFMRVLREYERATTADERAFKLEQLVTIYRTYRLSYDVRIEDAIREAGVVMPS